MKRLWAPEEINEIAKTIKPGEIISYSPEYNWGMVYGQDSVNGGGGLIICEFENGKPKEEALGVIISSSLNEVDIQPGQVYKLDDGTYYLDYQQEQQYLRIGGNLRYDLDNYSGSISGGIGNYTIEGKKFGPNEVGFGTLTLNITSAPSETMTIEGNPPNFTGVLIDIASGEQALVSCVNGLLHSSSSSTGTFKGGVTFFSN